VKTSLNFKNFEVITYSLQQNLKKANCSTDDNKKTIFFICEEVIHLSRNTFLHQPASRGLVDCYEELLSGQWLASYDAIRKLVPHDCALSTLVANVLKMQRELSE